MRAILCEAHGQPAGLVLADVPSPRPAAGEVRVRVKAAGVNFPDVLMVQGKYQHKVALPFSPGYEIAGVVLELGSGVAGIAPGDAGVAVIRAGGFAEEALVPAERFWPMRPGIGFVAAAAFPLAYGTSYHALKDRARLQPGETLLVLGAAGGVGLAAVQLGKLMGARVIACASSPDKLALCLRHGADHAIDYSRGTLREDIRRLTGDRGVDVVLDPVGGPYAEPALRSIAWLGRYLVVGFAAGEIPRIPLNLPLLKGCAVIGVAWDTHSQRDAAAGRVNVAELMDWIATGQLVPAVTRTYPLEQAAQALADVMERRVQGKLVIVP